jgi:hypothetical protein
MDDIDRLIKKMGHDALIAEILIRKQHENFRNVKKPGAPRDSLGELLGLRDAFNHFQTLFPHEKNKYVADRVLKFIKSYRHKLQKPELYNAELEAGRELYQKVSWLKQISSKTVVNKIAKLNNLIDKISSMASTEQFPVYVVYDEIDVDSFADDPLY